LNGKLGQAVSYSAGRYVVAVLDAKTAAANATCDSRAAQPTFLKIKREQLIEASYFEQLKFGAGMAAESAKALLNSPKVEEYGEKVIAVVPLPTSIKNRLTPKTALLSAFTIGIALIWMTFGRVVGSTKILVMLSLIALISAVASPDILEGVRSNKSPGLILKGATRNFPSRLRDQIVHMTGYSSISERMALGLFILVLLFSGKVLLSTPSPPRPPPNMQMEQAPQMSKPHQAPQYDLEHIYKLGYDDGKSDKDMFTSLPNDLLKYNAAQEADITQDRFDDSNYQWAHDPPPPP